MIKRGLLLLLVVAFAAGTLVGCTKPTVQEPGEPKILRLARADAGATGSHHTSALGNDNTQIRYYVGTLYDTIPTADRREVALTPEFAAAEPVDVNGDGVVWQIPIREDAKWANGESIDADTFIYSWKMLIDPIMVNAQGIALTSRYVNILKADAYFEQGDSNSVAWDDVGIKKIDDHTLEITLDGPYSQQQVMRHFSWIATAPVYEPLYEEYMNAGRTDTQYGTSMETTMCSGAFQFTSWVVGAELTFEKNPHFPLADRVHMDGLVYTIVENAGTRIQMFENGDLHYTSVPTGEIEAYADDPRAMPTKTRTVAMVEVNSANPNVPLDNMNLKRALYYGVDRVTLAELASASPAHYLISDSVIAYGDGTSFRSLAEKAGYLPANHGYDPDAAVEYFETALADEGLNKIELTLNYNSGSDWYSLIAEFLQESWPKLFGEDRFALTINGRPSAQQLEVTKSVTSNREAYELTTSGWGRIATDYNPAEALAVWASDYPNRNGLYQSDALDALYAESRGEEARIDEKRLAEIALEGEKVFIEEILAIPIGQSTGMSLMAEDLIPGLEEYEIEAGYGLRFADFQR